MMDQETLRVVDDALRTYPLAPEPPTLVPQVRRACTPFPLRRASACTGWIMPSACLRRAWSL